MSQVKVSTFLFFFLLSCNKHINIGAYDLGYFDFIKKAELSLIEQDYPSANNLYKAAFELNKEGFADDHYNAFHVSLKVGDIDFLYFNAFTLAKLGMCMDFFLQFNELKTDHIKYASLVSTVESNSINVEYRDELEQILNDDQAVRYNRNEHLEQVDKVDSINFSLYQELIKKYGLPYENLIKIKCTDNFKGIQPMPYEIPLRHFAQQKYDGVDSLLDRFFKERLISPEFFAEQIIFVRPEFNCYSSPVVVMENTFYTYYLRPDEKKAIDEKRLKIGAHSIDDQIKLIKEVRALRKTGEFVFRLPVSIDVLPYVPHLLRDSVLIPLN